VTLRSLAMRVERLPAPPDGATEHEDRFGSAYAELTEFFDRFSEEEPRWRRRNPTYHRLVENIYRALIPRRRSVLEIGAGGGHLLAALEPKGGVGVDLSPRMVASAAATYPELDFVTGAGETVSFGRTFDYIVLSDVLPYAHDIVALLDNALLHAHRRTRIVINSYNPAWRPILALAELLRLKPRKPIRNWVSPGDVRNLLELSGFEVISTATRMLMPKRIPVLSFLLNSILGSIWPFTRLGVSYWIVARPAPVPLDELSVSVVCPCRNEAGHIPQIVERLPMMGSATELVFVEGGSTDDTRAAIERAIEAHPERDISLHVQPGRGKGDAVRVGFAEAKHDVLMILDADLTVPPEDLPKFYRAIVSNRGELINGSRLVYDMEEDSMRFANMLGNKAFSVAFRAITGHPVKDMLCGTKVLHRDDYRTISEARSFFGDFDPFGDFDLLFGAARLNLKILDHPVRYGARAYGTTNISRFRHGWLLLRMTLFAFWKFKVSIFQRSP
jgi:SAM-dependent methyltransferase